MLNVGIHENLVLKEATKNDKGTLVLTVKKVAQEDPLAALNDSGATNLREPEHPFMIFPPKVTNYDGEVDTVKNILDKIAEVKDPLDLILRQYTTSANIKWDIFAGTDVKVDNMSSTLTREDTILKIYNNIVDQFIAMVAPYTGETGKKMRMILPRRSKTSPYPGLRKRFLDDQPFIEPMTVSAASSKLAFSKFEKTNNLDKQLARETADQPDQEQGEEADALFTQAAE